MKVQARILRVGLALAMAACAAGGPAVAGEGTAELAARVAASERAFAKTMADRDHAAFGTFVAEEAVFFGGQNVLRGRAKVIEDWKRFYESEAAPFSWAPEQVEVLDSGTLALTSGPVHDPEGNRIGTFTSIWRLEPDGKWRVIFDKGCPPCQ